MLDKITLPNDCVHYAVVVLIAAILVRVAMSALRTFERMHPPQHSKRVPKSDDDVTGKASARPSCDKCLSLGFCWNFWRDLSGYCHPDEEVRDFLHPFILGTLELAAYPIFIENHHVNVIGAWLALKTASKWGEWKTNRGSFNRFLIGNALVVAVAFVLSQWSWLWLRPV